ncbi:MAG TPA: DUF4382 domain-containing protein [Longimicrobiales bacterium]|nr:DUF4382 domain-containing protein [Longimicrobiales bacterium]
MKKLGLFTALALAAVVATGCQDSTGPQMDGRLSILLTDAPGDFAAAVVTIESVYLQGGSEDSEQGRLYLTDEAVTVNLLDLQNVAMDLVDGKVIPGGTYPQLRMVISGGYVEVIEAEDAEGNPTQTRIYASSPAYAAAQGVTAHGSLQMPSYAESGLKINMPNGALRVDGGEQILLLDFNVAESFGQQAGASGMWVMTPVIHATDLQLTGSVEFSLALGEDISLPEGFELGDFAVVLDRNGDEITESFVEVDDAFKVRFNFLVGGESYPVSLKVPEGLTVSLDPAFPATVEAPSGSALQMAFTITAVTED